MGARKGGSGCLALVLVNRGVGEKREVRGQRDYVCLSLIMTQSGF